MKFLKGNRRTWIHRVVVESDITPCCFIDIQGEPARIEHGDEEPGYMAVGVLRDHPDYLMTWRGRVKAAWGVLRGELWGHGIEFLTGQDYRRFMEGMEEVGREVFGEGGKL